MTDERDLSEATCRRDAGGDVYFPAGTAYVLKLRRPLLDYPRFEAEVRPISQGTARLAGVVTVAGTDWHARPNVGTARAAFYRSRSGLYYPVVQAFERARKQSKVSVRGLATDDRPTVLAERLNGLPEAERTPSPMRLGQRRAF